MKKYLPLILFFCFSSAHIRAQDSCAYRLTIQNTILNPQLAYPYINLFEDNVLIMSQGFNWSGAYSYDLIFDEGDTIRTQLYSNNSNSNNIAVATWANSDCKNISSADYMTTGKFVVNCPDCPAITCAPLPKANNITDTSALLSWESLGIESDYEVVWGSSGFPLYAGQIVTVSDTFLLLGGLNPSVEYQFYVRRKCDTGLYSIYSSPKKFTTQNDFVIDTCNNIIQLTSDNDSGWGNALVEIKIGNSLVGSFSNPGNVYPSQSIDLHRNALTTAKFINNGASAAINKSFLIINPSNNDSVLVFANTPSNNQVFEFYGCPTCSGILDFQIDIFSYSVDLLWKNQDTNGLILVEYGPPGFTLGSGSILMLPGSSTQGTIEGLSPNQWVDIYIYRNCDIESSVKKGPIKIQTLTDLDCRVVKVETSLENCVNSELDTFKVEIKNFGGVPKDSILIGYKIIAEGQTEPFVTGQYLYEGELEHDSTVVVSIAPALPYPSAGKYNVTVTSALDVDAFVVNSSKTIIITVTKTNVAPFHETFEENSSMWEGYTLPTTTGNMTQLTSGNSVIWPFAGNRFQRVSIPSNGNVVNIIKSACFDLSELGVTPEIKLTLNSGQINNLQSYYLQVSSDEGNTWETLGDGSGSQGENWYGFNENYVSNDAYWGENDLDWFFAKHPLTSLQGQKNVRFRFVVNNIGVGNSNYFGIDDFWIYEANDNDLSAFSPKRFSTISCGEVNDHIQIYIKNEGSVAQSDFVVAFQAEAGTVKQEIANLTIDPGQTITYTTDSTINSFHVSEMVNVWVENVLDMNTINDNAEFFLKTDTLYTLPLINNFEWNQAQPVWIGAPSSNYEYIFSEMLGGGYCVYLVATSDHTIKPTLSGPSVFIDEPTAGISFKYRTTWNTYGGSYVLQEHDSLLVQVSTDCGENWSTISSINHENNQLNSLPTFAKAVVPLFEYYGSEIMTRFQLTATSPYTTIDENLYVLLDDINIKKCQYELPITVITTPAHYNTQDGSIEIQIDSASAFLPMTFSWLNGETSLEYDSLYPNTTINVNIKDGEGCVFVEHIRIELDTTTVNASSEILDNSVVIPNPTNGLALLKIENNTSEPLTYTLTDVIGNIINTISITHKGAFSLPIDISSQPPGVYLISLSNSNFRRMLRLIKI